MDERDAVGWQQLKGSSPSRLVDMLASQDARSPGSNEWFGWARPSAYRSSKGWPAWKFPQGSSRAGRKRSIVNPVVLGTAFGVVFIGELPDKTMFASLLLAARNRIGLVWL